MPPAPPILILAGADDPHADAVARALDTRGAAHVRIDRTTLVADGLKLRPHEAMIGAVDLDRVGAVWCRRFPRMTLPGDMPEMWRKWCAQEFAHAMLGGLMRPDVHWVSDYFAIQRAGHKALQLHLARAAGLNVPDYVITSDAAAAQAFVAASGGAVFKPLGPPTFNDADTVATLFTHDSDRIGPDDWAGLDYAPMIFQRRIDRVAEIRVSVVGDRVLATRIDVTGVAEADYRRVDPYTLPHAPIDLPVPVAEGCRAVMRALGLRFGAFDLLLDRQGGFHFLEVNPNGQWYWIEDLTGLPIAAALADELIGGAARAATAAAA